MVVFKLSSEIVLSTKGIVKEFPGVVALKGVDFDLRQSEIHSVVGQNGAGKSTLVKILSGVYTPTRGEIFVRGVRVRIRNVRDAKKLGITLVHQEATLVPNLSVAENIALALYGVRGTVFARAKEKELLELARNYLELVKLRIDPRSKVRDLGVGERQLVQIARAIAENADIICLDEPTSPLTSMEAKVLFEVMEELRKKGKSMVFITHRVEEVFQIANRVTVLRDGVKVFTEDVSKTSPYEVIKHMLGKELEEFYPPRVEAKSLSRTSPRLRVVSLTTASNGKGVKLEGVSFDVYPGEILGVVGLLGSGKTELGKALVGAQRVVSGEIYVNGVKATIKSPVDALKLGIFYIPEDRRREGLVTQLTISDNIVLPKVFKTSSMSLIRQAQVERSIAGRWIKSLRIVPSDPSFKVANLSGGNQQKVVIAKSLETGAKILILDEPTFGIDIGTKVEIRKLIRSLASEGYSIVLLTSDVDEALALSDRILVIASGRVTNVMENRNLSREILISMLGGQVG